MIALRAARQNGSAKIDGRPIATAALHRQCACCVRNQGPSECADRTGMRRWLQPRLAIGASNDPLEREADCVANRILAEEGDHAAARVQRAPSVWDPLADIAPESVEHTLARPGRPLERTVRSDMEQRFGHDFSMVRVHTDAPAAQSAKEVQARAYTVGHNLVFATNQYAPSTPDGRRLLAHELTHVLQQEGAGIRPLPLDPAGASRTAHASATIVQRDREVCTPASDNRPTTTCGPGTNDPFCLLHGGAQGGKNACSKDAEATDPDLRANGPKRTPVAPVASGARGTSAASAAASFARDPGCDFEAPATPSVSAPLRFTPDPAATLPAKESAPDLSVIAADQPWWNDSDAEHFGSQLAACYAARTSLSAKPIDAAAKLVELQADFDRVVQGSFGRSPFGLESWSGIRPVLTRILQRRRNEIASEQTRIDAKLPKERRRDAADLGAAVELRMQSERHDLVEKVRIQVALGAWGWMAERREKVDFDTLGAPGGRSAKLAEILTDAENRAVVHAILDAKKRPLSDKESERAIAGAQSAKDASAKRAKVAPSPLSEDEKAAAIAAAELDIVKSRWPGELRAARIEARTNKDAANLVVPTTAEVKGWSTDSKRTRIHKDVIAVLQTLETEFPAGFSAGTYTLHTEGDHASGGFEGRFRSLDMYPNGGASRTQKPFGSVGFFEKQIALDFALAIDRAVAGRGSYQILYNDFEVAREANKRLKNGRMMNVDNVVDTAGHPANLNWHGPLVTHFHVDFAI